MFRRCAASAEKPVRKNAPFTNFLKTNTHDAITDIGTQIASKTPEHCFQSLLQLIRTNLNLKLPLQASLINALYALLIVGMLKYMRIKI